MNPFISQIILLFSLIQRVEDYMPPPKCKFECKVFINSVNIFWSVKWFSNNTLVLEYSKNWNCWCFYYKSYYIILNGSMAFKKGLSQWLSSKEFTCRRCGFDPWVGKIPWRRAWQPILVSLTGKSLGQQSLEGYSP